MNNILVEILCCETGNTYDVLISVDCKMHEALKLIKSLLSEVEKGSYVSNETTLVFDRDNGEVLNLNKFVCDLGLKNGSHLCIV